MTFKASCTALLLMLSVGVANAGQWLPYTDAQFSALTKAGHSVVLDVHADWCPTCQRQQPVLKALVGTREFSTFDVLVVNFDDQEDVRRRFNVPQQSTLLVFKGAKEVVRATGITDKTAIAELLNKGR